MIISFQLLISIHIRIFLELVTLKSLIMTIKFMSRFNRFVFQQHGVYRISICFDEGANKYAAVHGY